MSELSISSKKMNNRHIDSYLFWLRFKNVLSVSIFVSIFAVLLSITMFYRFNKIENKSWDTVEKSQINILLEKNQKI